MITRRRLRETWFLTSPKWETGQTQFISLSFILLPGPHPTPPMFLLVTIDNVIVSDSAPMLGSSVMPGEDLLTLTPHIHQPASLSSHHLSHVCLFSRFQPPGLIVSRLDHCNSPLNSFHALRSPTYLSLCPWRTCSKTQTVFIVLFLFASNRKSLVENTSPPSYPAFPTIMFCSNLTDCVLPRNHPMFSPLQSFLCWVFCSEFLFPLFVPELLFLPQGSAQTLLLR